MTQKEFRKHKSNLKDETEFNYCNEHDVSYEEYKKAQKKETRLEVAIVGIEIALLAFLTAFIGVKAIKDSEPVVTTPVFSNVNRAISMDSPISVYNNSSSYVFYSLQGEYETTIQAYSSQDIYLGSPQRNRTMYFESYDTCYWLSDDSNFNGYSDERFTSEEAWNGTFISVFDSLEKTVYLETHFADIGNISTTWLNGELLNTGVSRNVTKTYKIMSGNGTYSLKFNRDYINHYNTFNSLQVVSGVTVDNYTYYYTSRIYAYNSTNGAKVLMSANTSSTQASIVQQSNNLDIVIPSGIKYQETEYYLAPYLEDSSMTTNSWFDISSNYGLRAWLSNNKTTIRPIRLAETTNSELDLWSNFGDLFLIFWTAVTPIFTIKILPMVTIGGLIIAPLILGFVALLLALIKK